MGVRPDRGNSGSPVNKSRMEVRPTGCHQAFWRIPFAQQVHFYCVGTVGNSMGVMTPPSSVAGVQNLCGFAYKDYGTNGHVKIHGVLHL
jgi:hypothetical protein